MFLGDTALLLDDSIVLQWRGSDRLNSGTLGLNEHLCLTIHVKDVIFLELLAMNYYPPLVTSRSLTIFLRENWLQGFLLGHLPWRAMKRPWPTLRLIFLMAQAEATLHFLSRIVKRPSNKHLVVLSALIGLLDDAERKLLFAWISGHLRLRIDLLD
jgi:hypothetical protein